jgi:hypothetical protein
MAVNKENQIDSPRAMKDIIKNKIDDYNKCTANTACDVTVLPILL